MFARMKPYWPEQEGAHTLKKSICWLESDLRRCNPVECVGICEAIELIQWCIDKLNSIKYESDEWKKDQVIRARLRQERGAFSGRR